MIERQYNGHDVLYSRPYSNVTFAGTHNSPFYKFDLPACNFYNNQDQDVEIQLINSVRIRKSTAKRHRYCQIDSPDHSPNIDILEARSRSAILYQLRHTRY